MQSIETPHGVNAMTTTPHNIGDVITFTTPTGETLQGEITGRDWCGDYVEFYTVQTNNGARYHVNARRYTSGHWF